MGLSGLEPPTLRLSVVRSSQLSYKPSSSQAPYHSQPRKRDCSFTPLFLAFLAQTLRWFALGWGRGYGLVQGLWLCEAGFPTAVPKQILYPRQPDELGLRAYPISGLRIGFSLLKHAVSQRAALREISFDILANEDAISGGRTSMALARFSLLPLRRRVSQRFCGSTIKYLARERCAPRIVNLRRHRRFAAHGAFSRRRRSAQSNPATSGCAPPYSHAFA